MVKWIIVIRKSIKEKEYKEQQEQTVRKILRRQSGYQKR